MTGATATQGNADWEGARWCAPFVVPRYKGIPRAREALMAVRTGEQFLACFSPPWITFDCESVG